MLGMRNGFRWLAVLLLVAGLSACTATYRNHGYFPMEHDLDQIKVGLDTRETVAGLIGTPGLTGLLTDSGWYYVRSKFRHYAYKEPEEIEREVMAISFDENGVVQNIEHFGLEDGQVIAISRRVTESNVRGISILRQIFANFGRVDVSQLL